MIVEINKQNIKDINSSNQPFYVIGKLIPSYEDGIWSFTEEIFESSYEKYYPDDNEQYDQYIDNPNKIIYFCYEDGNCIGQIKVTKYWNKYAFIQDIAVAKDYRGHGVGKQLIEKTIEWAKQRNLPGLMLETQDFNLIACRFYHKLGFQIGAVDTMLYANFDIAEEKAIFWYLKF